MRFDSLKDYSDYESKPKIQFYFFDETKAGENEINRNIAEYIKDEELSEDEIIQLKRARFIAMEYQRSTLDAVASLISGMQKQQPRIPDHSSTWMYARLLQAFLKATPNTNTGSNHDIDIFRVISIVLASLMSNRKNIDLDVPDYFPVRDFPELSDDKIRKIADILYGDNPFPEEENGSYVNQSNPSGQTLNVSKITLTQTSHTIDEKKVEIEF